MVRQIVVARRLDTKIGDGQMMLCGARYVWRVRCQLGRVAVGDWPPAAPVLPYSSIIIGKETTPANQRPLALLHGDQDGRGTCFILPLIAVCPIPMPLVQARAPFLSGRPTNATVPSVFLTLAATIANYRTGVMPNGARVDGGLAPPATPTVSYLWNSHNMNLLSNMPYVGS